MVSLRSSSTATKFFAFAAPATPPGQAKKVGETAVSGALPFTGIPLWIAALLGAELLAAGFALRRTA